MAIEHGLFSGHPPPSKEVLSDWLTNHEASIDSRSDVEDMDEGGWRVVSNEDIYTEELLFSICKASILSTRTSSLSTKEPRREIPIPAQSDDPPKGDLTTNYTILELALHVLHEIRLGKDSIFWGYLQSLPRDLDSFLLPQFWTLLGGEDGKKGREWLSGTECEKDILRKDKEGLSLTDIEVFYTANSARLSPTPTHPEPSSFTAFIYCYSIVLSRAFIIDLYHTTALVPFADIFNHSSTAPHTSLSSDEFVCHRCGSMKRCPHDVFNSRSVPRRLAHLWDSQRETIENEVDTVEMRLERNVEKGGEIFNSYGNDLGDGRLLAEWGFISEEFAGPGLTFDEADLAALIPSYSGPPIDQFEKAKRMVIERTNNWSNSRQLPMAKEHLHGEPLNTDGLCCVEPKDLNGHLFLDQKKGKRLYISQGGQISIDLMVLVIFQNISTTLTPAHTVLNVFIDIEKGWEATNDDISGVSQRNDPGLVDGSRQTGTVIMVLRTIQRLLSDRLCRYHRARDDVEGVFNHRDGLQKSSRLEKMALTLSLNERTLAASAVQNIESLIEFIEA